MTRLGRYIKFNPRKPKAWAVCDYSGMYCMHHDLVKQMQYAGNGLIWTGLLVNKEFADIPNPQMLTPILMPDPIPIEMPRPDNVIAAPGSTMTHAPYPKIPNQNTLKPYPESGALKNDDPRGSINI